MGKLADLRNELDSLDWDDPRVPKIQEKINETEQWCIDNHPDWNVKLTVWGKTNSDSELYPWHVGTVNLDDIYMVAELNGKGINLEHDGKIHICGECTDKS